MSALRDRLVLLPEYPSMEMLRRSPLTPIGRPGASWVAALIALAGCDAVFGLDREEVDCGIHVAVLDEQFEDEVEACEPWAYRFDADGTTVIQRNGDLQVTPRGTGAAGCVSTASYRFPRGGLIAEVKEVVSADGAYTSLSAGDDDSIQMANGELLYEASNASKMYSRIPYEPAKMRWWKLHDEQGVVTASYSATGLSDWVVFGQRSVPGTRNVQVAVLAGLFLPMPDATGAARYARLLVCD